MLLSTIGHKMSKASYFYFYFSFKLNERNNVDKK